MIRVNVNGSYKEIDSIFLGGSFQKEVIRVWSANANDYVYRQSNGKYLEKIGTILSDGSPFINYIVYGNSNGAGTEEKSENLISYDDFAVIDIGTGTERYGVNMGVLPVGDYEISWDSIDSTTSLWLNPIVNGSPQAAIRLTTPYRFTADGMTTYILRTNKATDTPPIDQLVDNLTVNSIRYYLSVVTSNTLANDTYRVYFLKKLQDGDFVDYKTQKIYRQNVPTSTINQFKSDNSLAITDPEAIVIDNNKRIRITITGNLGTNYVCKEIGVIYSNTENLCDNNDLTLYRVNNESIKKGSRSDGIPTRISNVLDIGYGIKVIGFMTISDGTYDVTMYTNIIIAEYESLKNDNKFLTASFSYPHENSYPENLQVGEVVPTVYTYKTLPTTISSDSDNYLYVEYWR